VWRVGAAANGCGAGHNKRPTRSFVAKALQEASGETAALAGYRIHTGIAGADKLLGRRRVQDAYVKALLDSKIVVTCNPDGWEGDYRTFEAMASGALVLVDRMSLPPPVLQDGINVVFYNSTSDMLRKVKYFLEHPGNADMIADRGARAVWTPDRLVDDILDVVLGRGGKASIYMESAIRRNHQAACLECNFTMQGLQRNPRSRVAITPSSANVIFLMLQVKFSGLEVDSIISKHKLEGRTLVAIDFTDSPYVLSRDERIDFYFKRSRVVKTCRKPFLPDYAKMLPQGYPFPLHFPLKYEWQQAVHAQQALPRRSRPTDVSCFFEAPPHVL